MSPYIYKLTDYLHRAVAMFCMSALPPRDLWAQEMTAHEGQAEKWHWFYACLDICIIRIINTKFVHILYVHMYTCTYT